MTPSCCPAIGRIPRVEGGLMLGGGGEERKGVALVDYQVHGLHRERSHEQSRMIFFFVVKRRGKHFVQRGVVLAHA